MKNIERKFKWGKIAWTSIMVLSILCLSVPTIIVIFYGMPSTLYKTINVIGLILAAIRICSVFVLGIMVYSIKQKESEGFKKQMSRAVLLFVIVALLQMFNLMFVHTN